MVYTPDNFMPPPYGGGAAGSSESWGDTRRYKPRAGRLAGREVSEPRFGGDVRRLRGMKHRRSGTTQVSPEGKGSAQVPAGYSVAYFG